jgi:hypothetical protein
VTLPAFEGFVRISLHSALKRSKSQNTGFQSIYLVCHLAHERTLAQNSAILKQPSRANISLRHLKMSRLGTVLVL